MARMADGSGTTHDTGTDAFSLRLAIWFDMEGCVSIQWGNLLVVNLPHRIGIPDSSESEFKNSLAVTLCHVIPPQGTNQ
jgi:hypothetical protein